MLKSAGLVWRLFGRGIRHDAVSQLDPQEFRRRISANVGPATAGPFEAYLPDPTDDYALRGRVRESRVVVGLRYHYYAGGPNFAGTLQPNASGGSKLSGRIRLSPLLQAWIAIWFALCAALALGGGWGGLLGLAWFPALAAIMLTRDSSARFRELVLQLDWLAAGEERGVTEGAPRRDGAAVGLAPSGVVPDAPSSAGAVAAIRITGMASTAGLCFLSTAMAAVGWVVPSVLEVLVPTSFIVGFVVIMVVLIGLGVGPVTRVWRARDEKHELPPRLFVALALSAIASAVSGIAGMVRTRGYSLHSATAACQWVIDRGQASPEVCVSHERWLEVSQGVNLLGLAVFAIFGAILCGVINASVRESR